MRDEQLLEQLAAALRTSPAPISTAELAAQMPRVYEVYRTAQGDPPLCLRGHDLIHRNAYVDLIECRTPFEHLLSFKTMPTRLFPLLGQLRSEGRCERISTGRLGPATLWMWVPPRWTCLSRRTELALQEMFAEITARFDEEADRG